MNRKTGVYATKEECKEYFKLLKEYRKMNIMVSDNGKLLTDLFDTAERFAVRHGLRKLKNRRYLIAHEDGEFLKG